MTYNSHVQTATIGRVSTSKSRLIRPVAHVTLAELLLQRMKIIRATRSSIRLSAQNAIESLTTVCFLVSCGNFATIQRDVDAGTRLHVAIRFSILPTYLVAQPTTIDVLLRWHAARTDNRVLIDETSALIFHGSIRFDCRYRAAVRVYSFCSVRRTAAINCL